MPRLPHRVIRMPDKTSPFFSFSPGALGVLAVLTGVLRVLLCLLPLFLLASSALAQPAPSFTLPRPADAAEALRLSFYSYDRSLPLNAKRQSLDANSRRARYLVTYDSAHDQRVTA